MGVYISNNNKRLIKVSSLKEPLAKQSIDYEKIMPLIDKNSYTVDVSSLKITQLSESQLLALENDNNVETNQIYITYDDNITPVFPVGAIYLSTSLVSPASMFGGTWEQLPANYALWTATSSAGNTISAGLPNITGSIALSSSTGFVGAVDDVGGSALTKLVESRSFYMSYTATGAANRTVGVNLDASKSNSIYGTSTTVQPPAIKVYAWKRVVDVSSPDTPV